MFLFDQLSSVSLAVKLVSRFLRCVMLILAILDCTNHTGLLDQTQREVTALVMCNTTWSSRHLTDGELQQQCNAAKTMEKKTLQNALSFSLNQ